MLKSIHCDSSWQESEIKKYIKKSIEVFLNNMREQRILNLGEDTIFEDLTPNEFQITAGNLFKGLIIIEKGPSDSNYVKISYDDNDFVNKTIWEGFIKKIEKQLTHP